MAGDPEDHQAELRAAKPLHCVAADGTVKFIRRTGRPKKVFNRPTIDEQDYARRIVLIAERFVAADPLVQAATKEHRRNDLAVIDEAMLQLAREAASLKFEALKLLGEGREFGAVSSRRVDALSQIASLLLLREKLGVEKPLDPRNPKVQRVVAAFLGVMRECARETLGPVAETFLARFGAMAVGWEERCEAIAGLDGVDPIR